MKKKVRNDTQCDRPPTKDCGGMLKYAVHTWSILEDCGNHKKLNLQSTMIRSRQGKKVLEEWRACMSYSCHASW